MIDAFTRAEARALRSHRRCVHPLPPAVTSQACRAGARWGPAPRGDPCTHHQSTPRYRAGAVHPRTVPKPGSGPGGDGSASPPKQCRQCDNPSRGLPRSESPAEPDGCPPVPGHLRRPAPAETGTGSLLHRGAGGVRSALIIRPVPAWTKRLPKLAPLLHRCLSTCAHRSVHRRVRPCRQRLFASQRSGRGRCGWCQTPIDFRALLHRRVRSVSRRCQFPTPYTSMGFVPLRGSPRPPAA
jgi:hypothetical protein